VVGSIYGMNFDHMPELHWLYGYPAAIALMALSSLAVFIVSKRAGWL
jgi:magnesium transporter